MKILLKIRTYYSIIVVSLLFVLLLTACLSILYIQTTKRLKQDQIDTVRLLASNAMTAVENELLSTIEIVASLETSDAVEALIRASGGNGQDPSLFYRFYRLQRELGDLFSITGKQTIESVLLLYDAEKPFAITSATVVDDLAGAFERKLFAFEGLSCSEFIALVRDHASTRTVYNQMFPARGVALNDVFYKDCFIYVSNLRQISRACDVYAVILLSREKLDAALSPLGWPIDIGRVAIDREAGQGSILSFSGRTFVQGRTTFVHGYSSIFGLAYQIALDDGLVLAEMGGFLTLIVTLLALCMLLAMVMVALAILFAARPVKTVLDALERTYEQAAEGQDVYRYISDRIRFLSRQNRENEAKLLEYQEDLVAHSLARYFRTATLSQKEANMVSSLLESRPGCAWHVVVLGKAGQNHKDRITDEEGARMAAVLKDIAAPGIFVCAKEPTHWTLLCSRNAKSAHTIQGFDFDLQELMERMSSHTGHLYAVGVGCACDTVSEMYLSFREAWQVYSDILRNNWARSAQYCQIGSLADIFLISYRDMNKLHCLLVNAQREEVDGMLEELHRRMRAFDASPQGNEGLWQQFDRDLHGIASRVLLSVGYHQEAEQLSRTGGLDAPCDEAFDRVREMVHWVLALCAARNPSKTDDLSQEIVAFVQKNYANSLLSLGMLAERFHMTEKYLSQFFKQRTGINYSEYLENIRLEHAEAQILKQRLPVGKVAESVGYSSTNTFFKAFKRRYGVTPTEWLRQHSAVQHG